MALRARAFTRDWIRATRRSEKVAIVSNLETTHLACPQEFNPIVQYFRRCHSIGERARFPSRAIENSSMIPFHAQAEIIWNLLSHRGRLIGNLLGRSRTNQ